MAKSGSGSRRKGRGGEYEACDKLQALFYPNGEGEVLRTPMSGAWHGMPVMSGDVIFLKKGLPDDEVGFFVEVKRYSRAAISPLAWLCGDTAMLEGWLEQATTASKRGSSTAVPIVMWRTDFAPWFVVMAPNDVEVLRDRLGGGPSTRAPFFIYRPAGRPGIAMLPFEFFCEWVRRGKT